MSQLHRLMRKLGSRSPTNSDDGFTCIQYRNIHDIEPALFVAIRGRHHSDLEDMLQTVTAVDVNSIPDGEKITALHLACEEDNIEAVRLIVRCGGDVNKQDKRRCSPLLVAATVGSVEITRFLLEHGACVNQPGNQEIPDVALTEYETASYHLDKEEVLDAYYENTPLIQACRQGFLPVVKALVEHGCDLNLQNRNGNTALHVACLGRTFYPYATNQSHFIPSSFFSSSQVEIISFLLSSGARMNITNKFGHTPLQRIFQIRCSYPLKMTGWGFSCGENNQILIKTFKAIRTLLQYGCNLPRIFIHGYQDPVLSEELLVTVKYAENFGIQEALYEAILETLLFALDNGCMYTSQAIQDLESYDPGFKPVVERILPCISAPRPLAGQCRTFIRAWLMAKHHSLSDDIVGKLAVPKSVREHILGGSALA